MSRDIDAAIVDAQHIIETAGDGDDIARDQAAQFLSRPEIVRRLDHQQHRRPDSWAGMALRNTTRRDADRRDGVCADLSPGGAAAMRQPTPDHVAYDWHRRVLAGERLPVYEDAPQCGWFEYRRRGQATQAAVIWIEQEVDQHGELVRDEVLRCMIGGEYADPRSEWLWLAKRPITKAAYDALRLRDAEANAGLREPPEPFDPRTAPVARPF